MRLHTDFLFPTSVQRMMSRSRRGGRCNSAFVLVEGPSLAIALGAFTGGALHVAERGDLDLHDRWESYDGAAPHCTRPWEGERFALLAEMV